MRKLVERELTSEGPNRSDPATGKRRTVTMNAGESPIEWLHARGHLDRRLFDAGEALRRDYERAQLSLSVTMRWDPVMVKTTGDQGLTGTEKQIAAKSRFDGAMALAGKGLEDVLWRVVCAGEGIPETEKSLGWPARSGKLVLKFALERVADYYRIA
ncbi:DUF6456 domain-containing protein [Erythrobacter sp. MTPC3]|uniref:DUF6456 domain-containing protein n=1 Tax=Erythrobacter sp. MTPC3 TaxID=3056564 RepID=UPI0036F3C596